MPSFEIPADTLTSLESTSKNIRRYFKGRYLIIYLLSNSKISYWGKNLAGQTKKGRSLRKEKFTQIIRIRIFLKGVPFECVKLFDV